MANIPNQPSPAALYRKYRSRGFTDLMGQSHVTTSLSNAIKSGRISHAYLFAGPRGTGKTSTARIFAQAINKLKPEEALGHLDIIEIDAASNRRIDEIRDLREKVHSAPASAPYKVYIIDEAHMLTTEAFNALLKTLEEPPAHAIFILATTEPHKLPATIISRTQAFNFLPLSQTVILERLKYIAQAEKIKAPSETLELLSIVADGSMRDAIGLLDQLNTLSGGKAIAVELAAEQLGLVGKGRLQEVTSYLLDGDLKALVTVLDELAVRGLNPQQFARQLSEYIRHLTRAELGVKRAGGKPATLPMSRLTQLARLLRTVSNALGTPYLSWATVEAWLLDFCLSQDTKRAAAPEPEVRVPAKASKHPQSKPSPRPSPRTQPQSAIKQVVPLAASRLDDGGWTKILSHIKTHHNSLYALLKAAEPEFQKGKIVLGFKFQFHKRRLEDAKNLALLHTAIEEAQGQHFVVETALIMKAPAASEKASPVASVLEILGGEVVKDDS